MRDIFSQTIFGGDEMIGTKVKIAKKARSPELERLIRTLEVVATDLPRIMRREKEVAFETLERVDLFEDHMKAMRAIPAHLEALTRVVDRSLQVDGAAAHLSRAFQAIHNMRPVEPDPWEAKEPPVGEIPSEPEQPEGTPDSQEATWQALLTPDKVSDPEGPNGEDAAEAAPKPRSGARRGAGYRTLDLNLEKVRNAIVPGGEICGRSMFESSRARLVTARASGVSPWRFQFRHGSLQWAAQAEAKGLRGVAALICADLGYVEVPARLLLEKARDHLMTSSGGNTVVRPSLAVYGSEAILHPGAMSASKPGEAMKLAFVEF
jgi:hypothetical protein